MINASKVFLQVLLGVFTLALLQNGDFTTAVLLGALSAPLGALMFGSSSTLTACVTTCATADITSSDECNLRGGMKTVYWCQYADIDWATMAADPLQFSTANQEILGYTMVGGAVFNKLTFDRKQGTYSFTYTEDAGVYEQVITMIFEGKSRDIRNAFAGAVGCCKLICHIFDNNCLERVVGVEWDGSTFEPQVKTLRMTRHADESGEFGTSVARDEMDIGGESITPPLFASVGETNIPV